MPKLNIKNFVKPINPVRNKYWYLPISDMFQK